jgi:hypothetical protein
MASRDHKARVRPLVRKGPKSPSTSIDDRPCAPGSERERRLSKVSQMAGVTLAVAVIEGIIETHDTFERTQQHGKSSAGTLLDPIQRNGLNAAIYFLHQYVDTLTPEQGG